MDDQKINSKLEALPDIRSCRAAELSIADFAECLVSNQFCVYSLTFGNGFLCKHPRRSEIVRNTRKLSAPDAGSPT
jgi:hypothetical protein